MANTTNYNWPLPSPSGLQMNEIAKTATSFSAIDTKIKAFETSFSNHKHRFADLEEKPHDAGRLRDHGRDDFRRGCTGDQRQSMTSSTVPGRR